MEDFKSELKKIVEWELSERHKLEEEAIKKYGRGYDGVPPEKYKELKDISLKKAEELKKKYSREELESKPIVKTRTSNQLIHPPLP